MGIKMTERTYSRSGFYPEGALSGKAENMMYTRSREALAVAAERGMILESSCIMCDSADMTLKIELPDGVVGIMERGEVSFPLGGETKDIAVITRVGKPVQYKILRLDGKAAYLSRRAAQEECYEKYISTLLPGDVIPAKVTHLEPFGAFCDIGAGIVSLLTVDRISVSRISHPSDRFRTGEFISTVVSAIGENGRIYLTHRELLGTWEENASRFSAGQTVTGIVRSIEEYGVFVELAPNLAGLAEVTEGVEVGDACSVYIKSINPERMKIKLVIIDTCGKAELSPAEYYIDTARTWHIGKWLYSPEYAVKTVGTVFDE